MSTQGPQTWGESLFLALRRVGGLPKVLQRLGPVIDNSPGYRAKASYDELTQLVERPKPYTAAYVRAWLLAVAADTNLELLELSDDELPAILSPDHIRGLLGQPRPRKRRRRPPPSAGGLSIVV